MSAAYMSVKKLAERWDTHPMAVYRQVDSGRLPALRLGQSIRIPVAAVEECESANTTGIQSVSNRLRR